MKITSLSQNQPCHQHLQITIFVDENIWGFQITMNDVGSVQELWMMSMGVGNNLEAFEDLVHKILHVLFLQFAWGNQTLQIGTHQFCHKIATPTVTGWVSYMSSDGEIKQSISEIICQQMTVKGSNKKHYRAWDIGEVWVRGRHVSRELDFRMVFESFWLQLWRDSGTNHPQNWKTQSTSHSIHQPHQTKRSHAHRRQRFTGVMRINGGLQTIAAESQTWTQTHLSWQIPFDQPNTAE